MLRGVLDYQGCFLIKNSLSGLMCYTLATKQVPCRNS